MKIIFFFNSFCFSFDVNSFFQELVWFLLVMVKMLVVERVEFGTLKVVPVKLDF